MPEEICGAQYRPSYPLEKFLSEALAETTTWIVAETRPSHRDFSVLPKEISAPFTKSMRLDDYRQKVAVSTYFRPKTEASFGKNFFWVQ